MSEHQIFLPDRVYADLLAVAQSQGLSPIEWIESNLTEPKSSQPAPTQLFKDVSDLIGSIDSQAQPHQTYQKTAFSEAIASKLAKQGIQLP
jgi:hypothetical protein